MTPPFSICFCHRLTTIEDDRQRKQLLSRLLLLLLFSQTLKKNSFGFSFILLSKEFESEKDKEKRSDVSHPKKKKCNNTEGFLLLVAMRATKEHRFYHHHHLRRRRRRLRRLRREGAHEDTLLKLSFSFVGGRGKRRRRTTTTTTTDDADAVADKKKDISKAAGVLSNANRAPVPNRLSRQNCLSLRPCCHSFCLSLCFRLVCRRKMSWIGARKCGFLFLFFSFVCVSQLKGRHLDKKNIKKCRDVAFVETTFRIKTTTKQETRTTMVPRWLRSPTVYVKNYCTTLLPMYDI